MSDEAESKLRNVPCPRYRQVFRTIAFILGGTFLAGCVTAPVKVVNGKPFCVVHNCPLTKEKAFRFNGFITFDPKENKYDRYFPNRWSPVCSRQKYDGYNIPVDVTFCQLCTDAYLSLKHKE